MDRTVIFLGAGASAADKAPVQSQVLAEYVKAIHDEHFNKRKGVKDYENILREFFDRYYGIDIFQRESSVDYPPFEEILGILEVEMTEVATEDKEALERIKEGIIYALEIAIEYSMECNEDCAIGRRHHDKLVKSLKEKGLLGDVSFISLNYDTLIDSAITHVGCSIDYGFYTGNEDTKKSVQLYKLHGSLNWRKVEDDKNPIIIPPTYFKIFPKDLKTVWEKAFKKLMEAEQIIFCGYSLPDADLSVKVLLKRMELLRGENLPKIKVCNYFNDKSVCDNTIEKRRFDSFFKSETAYELVSFEQFVKNPEKYLMKGE